MDKQKAIRKLKKELSDEWSKPKAQNIREKTDTREARSYKKIKELQYKINELKTKRNTKNDGKI